MTGATKRYRRATAGPSNRRRGISLLEIVLSLALMAIAASLLSQLVSIGNRAAAFSRDMSKAQVMGESVMAEVVAGVLPQQATSGVMASDAAWTYTIDVSPLPPVGLSAESTLNVITVTVQRGSDTRTSFTLTRYVTSDLLLDDSTETDDSAGASDGGDA